MEQSKENNALDILTNYGQYHCNIGKVMDSVGVSIAKMQRLTGLNYEVVKKYYNDGATRIDKEVLARMTHILLLHGADCTNIIEYIPPTKSNN